MCGEQPSTPVVDTLVPGSPPRVRGTASSTTGVVSMTRITPACAGNSSKLELANSTLEDHPRVCGEQGELLAGRTALFGSPPRVRGTAP